MLRYKSTAPQDLHFETGFCALYDVNCLEDIIQIALE